MRTTAEISKAIIATTSKIACDFPELIKYVNEMRMPVNSEKGSKVSAASLEEYHKSLLAVIKKYAPNSAEIRIKIADRNRKKLNEND